MKSGFTYTDIIDIVMKERRLQKYSDCVDLASILYEVFGSLSSDFIFEFNDLNLYEQYSIVFYSAVRIGDKYVNKSVRNLDRLAASIREGIKTGVYKNIWCCWLPDWFKEVERCSHKLEDFDQRGIGTLQECEELYQAVLDGEKLIDSEEYVFNSRERVKYYYEMHKNRVEYLIGELRKRRK